MAPETSGTAVGTRPLCFAIGPYGEEDSDTRKWSNFLYEKILEPVLRDDFTVQRTIDDPEPGRILARIERDLQTACVVVADLTGANPNVYFEMGYRYAQQRPTVYVARCGTALPFDVRGDDVITINADFVEKRGYFTIPDDELVRARQTVGKHLKKAVVDAERLQAEAARRKTAADSSTTEVPVSAKVYDWQVWYSPEIHVRWLATQKPSFREEVERSENGGGTAAISEASLTLFAEYRALKDAASLNGEGTIFLTMNHRPRRIDVGYAAFRFATSPDPVLIKVVDISCGADGLQWIRFAQQSRPYQIDRGGQPITVTIPGYNYTLHVKQEPGSEGCANGVILHPHSRTELGSVELTPRYGEFLR
jgi:hypothetical protein